MKLYITAFRLYRLTSDIHSTVSIWKDIFEVNILAKLQFLAPFSNCLHVALPIFRLTYNNGSTWNIMSLLLQQFPGNHSHMPAQCAEYTYFDRL